MDYETMKSLREDIQNLKDHVNTLYALMQNVEHKQESLSILLKNAATHQEARGNVGA